MRRLDDCRRLKVGRREPSLEDMGLMGDIGEANDEAIVGPFSAAIVFVDT